MQAPIAERWSILEVNEACPPRSGKTALVSMPHIGLSCAATTVPSRYSVSAITGRLPPPSPLAGRVVLADPPPLLAGCLERLALLGLVRRHDAMPEDLRVQVGSAAQLRDTLTLLGADHRPLSPPRVPGGAPIALRSLAYFELRTLRGFSSPSNVDVGRGGFA